MKKKISWNKILIYKRQTQEISFAQLLFDLIEGKFYLKLLENNKHGQFYNMSRFTCLLLAAIMVCSSSFVSITDAQSVSVTSHSSSSSSSSSVTFKFSFNLSDLLPVCKFDTGIYFVSPVSNSDWFWIPRIYF